MVEPTSLHVLIVDDEEPARERLKRMFDGVKNVIVIGEASNGNEALELVEELQPDLMLLDINMPDLDGIRVLEAMDDPPAVIFSTAYDQYAVKAFEKEAVDYLLKPYSAQRLKQAVERARKLIAPVESVGEVDGKNLKRIPVDDGVATKLLDCSRIDLFLIEVGVVFVHSSEGERFTTGLNLQEIEERLPDYEFLRINRQAVVRLAAVESYSANEDGSIGIVLGDGTELTVSRRRARHFKSCIE